MPDPPPPLRVLVADDCKDSASSTEILIRLWGHDVRLAHDGLTALQVADAYRPEVVLLDIAMPRLDGYEVARRLRATPGLEGLCLVAVSGYGRDEDRRLALASGFDHHFLKPLDPDRLQRLLTSVAETGTCA